VIPELVASFDRTTDYVRELVRDVSEEGMVQQPPGVPNHPLWTLGHLAYSFQEIARELGATPWLPEEWEHFFGFGSSTDESVRSPNLSREVLLACFEDSSRRLRELLLATGEERLTDPLPDVAARKLLPTIGHALLQIVAAHSAYHAGQLAAWRRATGRGTAGVFI